MCDSSVNSAGGVKVWNVAPLCSAPTDVRLEIHYVLSYEHNRISLIILADRHPASPFVQPQLKKAP